MCAASTHLKRNCKSATHSEHAEVMRMRATQTVAMIIYLWALIVNTILDICIRSWWMNMYGKQSEWLTDRLSDCWLLADKIGEKIIIKTNIGNHVNVETAAYSIFDFFVVFSELHCISFQLSSTIARFSAKSWRLISFVNGVYMRRSTSMWRYYTQS